MAKKGSHQKRHNRTSKKGKVFPAGKAPYPYSKLREFEVTLCIPNQPIEAEPDDYGFSNNPLLVITALSKKEALQQLKLPKNVKVSRIEGVK